MDRKDVFEYPEKKLKRLVVEIRKSRREPHILNTECY